MNWIHAFLKSTFAKWNANILDQDLNLAHRVHFDDCRLHQVKLWLLRKIP